MAKGSKFLDSLEKGNKNVSTALLLAVFGLLLFIAFALTLPWAK